MRKHLLIGVIIVVLALGTMGAAFATGMTFSNVGALSLGIQAVPQINCDYVGFHLDSANAKPVCVDGVYLSFDTDFSGAAVSVSLRDINMNELCYFAKNNYGQLASETTCWKLQDETGKYIEDSTNTLPTADQVFYVKVTVGQNSVYNALPAGGWVIVRSCNLVVFPELKLSFPFPIGVPMVEPSRTFLHHHDGSTKGACRSGVMMPRSE